MRREDMLARIQFVCLGILVFMTPMTYRPVSPWLNFPFYELSYFGLLITFVLGFAVPKPKFPKLKLQDMGLPAFVILLVLNGRILGSPAAAQPVVDSLVLFFIVMHCHLSLRQVKTLLALLIAAGAIVSLLSIYQYLLGYSHIVPASFGNANTFSGFLSLLLPLSLGFWQLRNRPVRIFAIIATTLMAFAMVLTYTRSGWLVSILGMTGFALMKDRKLVLVIVLYIFVFGAVVDGAGDRFSQISQVRELKGLVTTNAKPAPNNVGSRVSLWKFAISEFAKAPVSGIGLGNFSLKLEAHLAENPQDKNKYVYGVEETHNSYLKFLSETGLPGLLLFISILIRWLIPEAVKLNKQGYSHLQAGILWGLVAFLLHNLTNNLFLLLPSGFGFWIVFGLLNRLELTQGRLRFELNRS